jgi:uncharacterized repeat protein (TIGR03803 family)
MTEHQMKFSCSTLLTVLVFLSQSVLIMSPASAQTFSTLYAFTGTANGEYPSNIGSLAVGTNRDVYGTAPDSTEPFKGRGVVFRITPGGQETVIDNFTSNSPDGKEPFAGLIADKAGNLYGTTWAGGADGWGTVFKLTPPKPGLKKWTETILHSFDKFSDGGELNQPLVMDAKGNIYGSALEGGREGGGTVFKLDTMGDFTVLHNFGSEPDGEVPSGLVVDPVGNLYGMTGEGGIQSCNEGSGCGVVFKLSPSGQETVLHTFTGGSDGGVPGSALVLDLSQQALFGVTVGGGEFGCGVVFKLDATGETVLYAFTCGTDGESPEEIVQDAAGNLYGSTTQGGDLSCNPGSNGCGVVFKIDTGSNFTVLYTFDATDFPIGPGLVGGLNIDNAGNLYGTTRYGGDFSCNAAGCGTVWKLSNASR